MTDATREVLKDSTADVKRFANWEVAPTDVRPSLFAELDPRADLVRLATQRQHKQEQQKVSNDFQKALQSFQAASKRSAERQRLFVERARANIDAESATGLSSR